MLTHDQLLAAVPNALSGVDLDGLGPKTTGKVRDIYHWHGQRVLVTSDRVSAFDRVLGFIPYKGQVLNQLSLWWFDQTRDVVANHLIASPDSNVTVAREAEALPVEVVVRGYITGVTSTSMWTMYEQGDRTPYGIPLPDGLRKNDRLPHPVITPTTKATDGAHDERITPDEILARGLVPEPLWQEIETVALALFARGQAVARDAGLVLVDTKYEFGVIDGELTLIDEVHTPDSSRFWRDPPGDDPQHYDKEHLRKWFAVQGYRGEGDPPSLVPAFAAQMAALYIQVYERLTGTNFVPGDYPATARIQANMLRYMNNETQ